VLLVVVERQRCPGGARDSETRHQRHGAMVARPYGNAFGVEDGPQIVRVYALDEERKYPRFLARGSNELQTRNLGQGRGGILEKEGLMTGDAIEADAAHIVDRRSEPKRARDIGRSSLEALRRRRVSAAFKAHGVNHVASALPRRHGLE